MTSPHHESAQGHLDAAREAQRLLTAEYAKPEPNRAWIAELHNSIRFALAASKAEAAIAVSEQLGKLLSERYGRTGSRSW